MEEQELAERCKQGDNLARKELYERYAGRLLSICLRYAGNRERAEDLMHDCFIHIFGSIDKFTWRGTGSLRAWLERVVKNYVMASLGKYDILSSSADIDEIDEVYQIPDLSEVEPIPESVLMRFLSELPDGYRTIFNLYVFEKKTHKEIAELLGINTNTSTSQLLRAKAALAKKIKQWQNDDYK
jgi:RNA polymerase sigma-70 factor (ECF subfamily)